MEKEVKEKKAIVKPRRKYKIGIEIEGIFNEDWIHEDEIGEYHEGYEYNSFWGLENDSSLHSDSVFNYDIRAEFISKVMKSKKKYWDTLDNFKSIFGDSRLKSCMYFNSSCGCHIHIGLNGGKCFYKLLPYELMVNLRNYFFKLLDDNKVLPNRVKKGVREQYFRSYAKKLNKKDTMEKYPSRETEFNKISEMESKGLEWRGFNLMNVETWTEFKEMFKICWKCINFLYDCLENGYNLKENLKFPKKDFKKIVEDTNEVKEIKDNESFFNYSMVFNDGEERDIKKEVFQEVINIK